MKSYTITMKTHAPGEKNFDRLAQALLPWYQKHGRKDLPWQMNKDPYRVWLSEIMLQQTQVKTVIPYFTRFVSQFPDVSSLANSCEENVLQLWAGLGYYSRAIRLHQAAKWIVNKHQGIFPTEFKEILALPGVGKSTAGAICSLSFEQRTPILDGNVKRVLSRYYGVVEPIEDTTTNQLLWDYAQKSMPGENCAAYSQAIMDLGATLCNKNPNCAICPLNTGCYAAHHGVANVLPIKKPSKALAHREATFLILRHQETILIEKRPQTGIWGGLWCLPSLEGAPSLKTIRNFYKQTFTTKPTNIILVPAFKHTFTHFHLTLHPVMLNVKQKIALSKPYQWYELNHAVPRAFPRPMQKIINQL